MRRLFVIVATTSALFGGGVSTSAAGLTPRAADAAAEGAARAHFNDGRQFRATCNPARNPNSLNQLRKIWDCEMTGSALAEDRTLLAEEGGPDDPWPWTLDVTVQWADGEWEATSISDLEWNPRLSLRAPRLGTVTARRLARSALRQEGFDFVINASPRTKCRRSSRTTVRCTFSWTQGDASGVSRIRVSMVPPRADNEWDYSWTTHIYDDYCYAVLDKPASKCTKVDRVR